MKIVFASISIIAGLLMAFAPFAGSSQADDTTIRITGHASGATPFISKVTLAVSNTSVLKSIQFTVTPKPGSVTRPLSGTYANWSSLTAGSKTRIQARSFCRYMDFTMRYNHASHPAYRFIDGWSKTSEHHITPPRFNTIRADTIIRHTYSIEIAPL